jgi:2-polyprenyl-6-hydroxyphenyl methylase/3-demethylubiquinone-9 3-methyltransferase
MSRHAEEVRRGERFEFGENWRRFLASVDEARITQACESLKTWLGVSDLRGRRFLDAGCGSGLFSLAARRLGADVRSFDYDPASCACTREMRERFGDGDAHWTVSEGSVLDPPFLDGLGTFDVVYSWGVLHHTGAMWRALELIAARAGPNGLLFVALYNDQGGPSRRWLRVKRAYNALPGPFRFLVLWPSFVALWAKTFAIETVRGYPGRGWREYARTSRGMSPWRDVVDWVGGLPFEVSRPEQVLDFLRDRGFTLLRMKTCGGGLGCNEFVFQRVPPTAP